ncbi:2-iminobutanoate/2-iminopropanoate deaminase [Microbacterium ginsengiterrae]|uniref:2-iminobutanoate/2-iminopropanoate deaminase n=1 Tax=Microbacterium ginsengiterrae TaxID=546115 RepID=A0A7W9CC78_9MICO|nr:Rid family detoxifying hydrolase [Microbacterium ginsengiterrae]MBB5742848.1 2-iminobutanoate/2-iminopropanoate deaminase [Microbacterium ginsengiterrae]
MQLLHTSDAPAPGGHYSQAVRTGDYIHTAGQVGLNAATGVTPSDFREQTRQALANLRAVLAEGGAEITDVVRTMCLLTDIDNFAIFNEEYAAFFGDHRPARSTFGIALAGGFTVEVEAIAYVGDR